MFPPTIFVVLNPVNRSHAGHYTLTRPYTTIDQPTNQTHFLLVYGRLRSISEFLINNTFHTL